MPANQVVHNVGGQNRFLDYVSLLPEFLREEPDVVTMMQIFTDYLNNAYRNVAVASKYEFKLVAVEGMVGALSAKLQHLADLFSACESKQVPCLYLFKPPHPATGVIEYSGDGVNLSTSIIPGGASENDRFFIDFTQYPDKSGVYVVTSTVISGGYKTMILDSYGFSQDPFGKSPDKPIMTPVGYAPRIIQFYPSDITSVRSRRVENTIDTIYYEVYFSATIIDITNVPSILAEKTAGSTEVNYLVDYYDYLGNRFPPNFTAGKYEVYFDSCDTFDNGRGVFYARDFTGTDRRSEMLDPQGNNIYIDPSIKYTAANSTEPTTPKFDQLFYTRPQHSGTNLLKIHYSSAESTIPDGSYVVRVSVGDIHSSCDLSLVSTTDSKIVLSVATSLKIGDTVQFIIDSGSALPGGISNDSTHKISGITSDGKGIYLSGVTFTSTGTGTAKLNKIVKSPDSVGLVDSTGVSGGNYVAYSSFAGNMVTPGQFGVMLGNAVVSRFTVTYPNGTNSIPAWDSSAFQYISGNFVYYSGRVYRVLKSLYLSSVYGTPDTEPTYYMVDMSNVSILGEEVVYNPYMFGSYSGRNIPYGGIIDYGTEGFKSLSTELLIQQSEESGVAFRYPQREWIFNPRVATTIDMSRNGWLEVYKLATSSNTDIANKLASQFVLTPTTTKVLGNRLTFTFNTAHGYSTAQYVSVSGATNPVLNGNFPIILVPDSKTIVVELSAPVSSGDILDVISIRNLDVVGNGTILFSKQNLFDVSDLNPALVESGQWYRYDLNSIEWSRYTTSDPSTYTGTVATPGENLSVLYGEYVTTDSLSLTDGMRVHLTLQTNSDENGYWRVVKNAQWQRLGTKLVMKIRDISIEGEQIDDLYNSVVPYYYTRYSDASVNAIISANPNVFKTYGSQIQNYTIMMPVVEGIDTTRSLHQIYDARYDSNTVAPMPSAFIGVPDMGYPLIEKIERLVYQKDPNVIDYSLIAYLARYMGYDITPVADDISQSQFYATEKARENAVRKVIQRLPEFNALKSTEKGLEVLMLTFGIVGKVINMWTESDDPYAEMIPSDSVMQHRYSSMIKGKSPVLVPTPHFSVKIEVEGNFQNELGLSDIGRIDSAIRKYKPINTVFDGIQSYMKITSNSALYMSPMKSTGKMQSDIGFDITFDEIQSNCSF